GGEGDTERDGVMAGVQASFRPDFQNRVDEIILFLRLQRKDVGEIVKIQLGRIERLLEDRKITLDLDQEAIDWLASKGYDPAYGARPLKSVLMKELLVPLAERQLLGEIFVDITEIVTSGLDGV